MSASTVFISNLSYKTTKDDLIKHFSQCGTVVDVDIQADQDGKPKGFALVTFSSPEEAVKAADDLDERNFLDRYIHVQLSRSSKKG